MPIYKHSDSQLVSIKEKPFSLERELQKLVETNIDEVFGLSFITTEFPLNGLRIDTLAFDEESQSFVVIEYKKGKNFSVIDQGYAYLSLLLNNKADFVLEFNERNQRNLRKDDIDWSQSRVIFVAHSFTRYQREAIGFQDLPIELWEVKKYDEDIIYFNQIKASDKKESIKTISQDEKIEKVSREVRQYSVEDHFKPNWEDSREIWDEFTQRILEIDPRFEVSPVRHYIGYKIDNKVIFNVKIRASKVLLELYRVQPEDLNDPENRVRYRDRSFEFYNKHVTQFDINNTSDIDYAIFLTKQVLKITNVLS